MIVHPQAHSMVTEEAYQSDNNEEFSLTSDYMVGKDGFRLRGKVRSCSTYTCQMHRNDPPQTVVATSLGSHNKPWTRLHVDYASSLLLTHIQNGYRYILQTLHHLLLRTILTN